LWLYRNQPPDSRVTIILRKVTRSSLATVLVALGFSAFACVSAADSQKPAAVSAEEIFSGTVTLFTVRSLILVHKVPGQPPVTREFVRDGKTTIEGTLRSKARVTVRYRALDNGGFVAVHIIVRSIGRAA
jgi:hypothetical protein